MEGPRGTRKEEFDEVLGLVNYVFRESRGKPPDMKHKNALLYYEPNLDNLRIIVEDGKLVSHIAILESEIVVYGCRTKVGSPTDVCTYPEYRKRGFATRLLEDSMKKLDSDGADIVEISGRRGLYKRAKCVEAGKVYTFRISQNDLKKFDDQDIELFPYEKRGLIDIINVHQKEPIRFHRSSEDFKIAIEGCAARSDKAETLTISKDNNVLAYLVAQFPEVKKGEKRVGNVVEYAGVRRAIVNAVKPIFDEYSIQELDFNIPFHDTEFIYALKQKGLFAASKRNISGTIKIINFPRLMKRFYPYIEERLGKKKADSIRFAQNGNKCAIYFNQERFDTDVTSLVQIVFGTDDGREREKIPREGEIKKILLDIFPLPLPWPGLNSV